MTRIQMTIYPRDGSTAKIRLIVETSSVLEARQLAEQLSALIKDHAIVWNTAPSDTLDPGPGQL